MPRTRDATILALCRAGQESTPRRRFASRCGGSSRAPRSSRRTPDRPRSATTCCSPSRPARTRPRRLLRFLRRHALGPLAWANLSEAPISRILNGRDNTKLRMIADVGQALGVRFALVPIAFEDRVGTPAENDPKPPAWIDHHRRRAISCVGRQRRPHRLRAWVPPARWRIARQRSPASPSTRSGYRARDRSSKTSASAIPRSACSSALLAVFIRR